MKWKIINTPLGLSQPCGVTCKSNLAGLDILGGAINGLANFGATVYAADADEMNNRRTNQANREINEQQIAYAREQYERERQENRFLVDQAYQRSSPSAQVSRYLAAGINPYLAMSGSGGSVGSAGASVGSPARGNQPNAIPMQQRHPTPVADLSGFGNGIISAAQFALASQRQDADIAAIKNKTQQDWIETLSKVENRKFMNSKLGQEVLSLIKDNTFKDLTWDDRANNVKLINDKLFADIQYQEAMTKFQDIINGFEPAARAQTLKNLEANYDKIMSEVYANNEEAAYKAALSSITGVEEQIKRDCADSIVDECYNKANEAYWNSERSARRYLLGAKLGDNTPAIDYLGDKAKNGKINYESPNKAYDDRPYRRKSSLSRSAKKRIILK